MVTTWIGNLTIISAKMVTVVVNMLTVVIFVNSLQCINWIVSRVILTLQSADGLVSSLGTFDIEAAAHALVPGSSWAVLSDCCTVNQKNTSRNRQIIFKSKSNELHTFQHHYFPWDRYKELHTVLYGNKWKGRKFASPWWYNIMTPI